MASGHTWTAGWRLGAVLAGIGALFLGLGSQPAHAVQFGTPGYGVSGSLDTTISLGLAYRTEPRDNSLIGKANLVPPVPNSPLGVAPTSGTQPGPGTPQFDAYINGPGTYQINADDGDLNYPNHSWISQELKVNEQLSLQWHNYGVYVQGYYFYDFANTNFRNNPLTSAAQHGQPYRSAAAEKRVGHRGQLLASYVYGNWQIGSHPLNVRVGNQVVNWGESTFLLFGISRNNPYDVAAFMKPGAQVKDVLQPVPMIFSSFGITQNLSVAGFWQWNWKKTYPGPGGYYFSTADPAGAGGKWINLSTGRFRDGQYAYVPRSPSKTPDNRRMYGFKVDYTFPDMTEVAGYAEHHNSSVPFVSYHAADPAAGYTTGRYFLDYPTDINTFGVSFNTLGPRGWSIAGELSYTPKQPMQINENEETLAELSPLERAGFYPPGYFRNMIFGNAATTGRDANPGEYIAGYRLHDFYQLDLTGIQIYGPGNWIRSNSLLTVVELGADYVTNLPDRNVFSFNAPFTVESGFTSQLAGDNVANAVTSPKHAFPNQFAWGLRSLLQGTYQSWLGSQWAFKPTLFLSWDINGTTPGPMRNFVKGNKQAAFHAIFDYHSQWEVSVGYNAYWGSRNYLRDRNYVDASVAYSF